LKFFKITIFREGRRDGGTEVAFVGAKERGRRGVVLEAGDGGEWGLILCGEEEDE
jgi:hypothetical protein